MQHLKTIILATAIAFFTAVTRADSEIMQNPLIPNGINAGNTYQRFDTAANWFNAQSTCTNDKGHLATITSHNENEWIKRNLLTNATTLWLGGTDEGNEGVWSWVTDEFWDFTFWNNGEPNNNGNENHLQITPTAYWNDSNWANEFGYICEWDNDANITEAYFTDFSNGADSAWSDPAITNSNGETFLAPSNQGFGAGTQTLALTDLPQHSTVTVIFDLYIIQSWDGNGECSSAGSCGQAAGPDNFQLSADGETLLFTNFANFTGGNTQAYPNQLPPYGEGGTFAPKTASLETGHLGFGNEDFGDTTYQMAFTFDHTAPKLNLIFDGQPNQEPADEGWGLDNVWIGINQIATIFPVTIVKTGTGSGNVISNPAGINCGTTCSANFADSTAITLTATPITGSKFTGWGGACAGSAITCSLSVTAASKNVTANFNLITYTVTPNTGIGGNVDPNTAQNVAPGQKKSFTVIPNSGYIKNTNVTGTCPQGNWDGNVWTTGIISADCTVNFNFVPVNPNSWFYPVNPLVLKGKPFTLDVHINTDNILVGSYSFNIAFDKTKLFVDTTQCDHGICPGTGALASMTVAVDNNNGSIKLAGFDSVGQGPSNDLQIAIIHFVARQVTGTTAINLIATELTDPIGDSIGLGTKGATVSISPCLCGDADGTGAVNIIDALAIARKVVGLPPPPSVNNNCGDVDRNGVASIVDAMHIARHSVGLLVVTNGLIGQPLPP